MSSAATRPPIDLRTAEGMLSFVDGAEDRKTWIAIGYALKGEFGDAAFSAWDSWSQNANNYNVKSCTATWRGLKAANSSGGGTITIGTLVALAKQGGYTFDASDAPKVDHAELARRRAERTARAAAATAERERLAATAEETALATWRRAERTGTSAYSARKGIDQPESCRYLPAADNGRSAALVIPMLRYDLPREQSLKGVQIIREDGSKKFTYGMVKPGTACRLGLPVVGEPVFVCEGYATGMSIRMALERRYPVFVAFDAYNLPVVVEAVYQALPTSPIIICADDDHCTAIKGLPNNVGRIQSQIALDSVMDAGARLVVRTYPVFHKTTRRSDKDSDFNDLHRLEGLGEVKNQLELSLEVLRQLATYA